MQRHPRSLLSPIALATVAALASTGCFVTGLVDDLTTPDVRISPDAWVPRIDTGDGSSVDTGSVAIAREFKVGDPVTVKMTIALRQSAPVDDVVDEEGNITLPLIGEFNVLGMTTANAERAIRKAYIDNKIYNDLTVNVINSAAKASIDEAYSITGAIRKRGRYPLKAGMTLQEAIIAAGDVTDFAGDKIRITRNGVTRTFSYRKIKRGTAIDELIRNGDIIEISD